MNRNDLPITADLFYARSLDRFTEEAVQQWGCKHSYVHAASITLPKPAELGSLDDVALHMAEAMFELTNMPQQYPWHTHTNVKMRSPEANPCDTKRSMCVGDVAQFIFPHADASVTVACMATGWTIIGRS